MNEQYEDALNKMLAKSLRDQLEILEPLSDKCSIYRVPKRERELYGTSYTPQVVSIGPLHHGKEELKAMEGHKRRYLHDFLRWSHASLEDLIACIRKNERRLRDCYAEPVGFTSERFIEIMLLDAIFIIGILVKNFFSGDTISSDDRIYRKPKMMAEIRLDVVLIENQLPFFILGELFQLSNILNLNTKISIIELTHCFFKNSWLFWVADNILEQQDFSQVEHFLSFLRICQLPKKPMTSNGKEIPAIPTIAELYQAGVKCELHLSQNVLAMEFDKKMGILKIPRFEIYDYGMTEILLRNLVIFEKCHYYDENTYMNHYTFMLAGLVKSEKDVEILDRSGIIVNWLGNNQAVANLFGSIESTVDREAFYFYEIVEDLNAHCKSHWHKWKANLRQNYFNTPWAGISVAAAAFLLLLTLIQTICSILQV